MRRLCSIASDRRGVTIVEFAIVAPVMMMLIMGLGDLAYQIYVQAILDGAIQKAGRDSAIQGGGDNSATIDAKVTAMIQKVATNATITFDRKNYDSFALIKPEPFTDGNNNGVRDSGECYTDINGNGQWDSDPGLAGQGGADDVTRYTVTVAYPHLFPVVGLLGMPATQTLTASTLLKNQPYQAQVTTTSKRLCN